MDASDHNALPHSNTWHIVGAGAMGCLWGARLRKKGDDCSFLVKPERQPEYSTDSNLIYSSPENQQGEYSVTVQPAKNPEGPIQNLIIATKASGVQAAIQSLKPCIRPETRILLLQNGMGTQQYVAETFPDNPVWAASVTDGAWLRAPLNVQHAGYGATSIGAMTETAHRISDDFFSSLQAPGLTLEPTNNIEKKLWLKLAVNSCINGLTVLYQCSNGELLDGGEREQHFAQLCEETSKVLEAINQTPEQSLLTQVTQVAQATGANYSSSFQDAKYGRQTELAWINGVLIETARKNGIELPSHSALMVRLKEHI